MHDLYTYVTISHLQLEGFGFFGFSTGLSSHQVSSSSQIFFFFLRFFFKLILLIFFFSILFVCMLYLEFDVPLWALASVGDFNDSCFLFQFWCAHFKGCGKIKLRTKIMWITYHVITNFLFLKWFTSPKGRTLRTTPMTQGPCCCPYLQDSFLSDTDL